MNNFKVLLVYPNIMMATLVPIGIAQISAILKKNNIDIKLFDTTNYRTDKKSLDEIRVGLLQIKDFSYKNTPIRLKQTDIHSDLRSIIEEFQPNLVGISIIEDAFQLACELMPTIKEYSLPIICGGVFTTLAPHVVLRQKEVDMICLGEGEYALLELCCKMRDSEDIDHIKNLWIKKNGRIIKNSMRPLAKLDDLPFIDYDCFEAGRICRPMYGKVYNMLHVEFDRGCPMKCSFCAAPALRNIVEKNTGEKYYRTKKVSRIIDELIFLKQKHNADYLNINSENFFTRSLSELKELKKLYARNVGLPFWFQTRPELITKEKLKICVEMGCASVNLGIEHGNEEFRKRILKRKCSDAQILKGIETVENIKLPYTVNNIIGFPFETRKLVFDTIMLNRKINPRTYNCFILQPYHGTRIRDIALHYGYLLKNGKTNKLLVCSDMRLDTLTNSELEGLQRTFPLYCRFPIKRFKEIQIAEKSDEKGNKMFKALSIEYIDKYF